MANLQCLADLQQTVYELLQQFIKARLIMWIMAALQNKNLKYLTVNSASARTDFK